ncbi:MAG: DNA translocase FtsK 4TM domain-containing protein [Gammaproteobacteria bacterium]|jgi:DNA segregation ATPase FtsK/SpoIIIE, S-DNA-T family|nr:DNA translocase FtsK 4TM domain-containing protein [Gammaproteobacteria bacterium]
MQSMLLKEGLLLVLLALAIYLFLALFSYSPGDPGWSRTGDPNNIANNVGSSGAWIADVLLILFGYLSYLIPIMLAYRAFVLFRERKQSEAFSWSMFTLRGTGFVLTLVGATALANMHFLTTLPESAGGILGGALTGLTLPVLDLIGSTLLSLTFLFVGITLATGLSWINVVDLTGKLCLNAWQNGSSLIQKWREERKEKQETQSVINRRKQALDTFQEKEKSRKPIKIAPVKKKAPEPSKRVQKEKQGKLFSAGEVGELPPISLLDEWVESLNSGYSTEALEAMSKLLEIKLKDFGIDITVEAINPGPVITRFEVQPAAGVKVSRISNLVKDLARSLALSSVRVVEVIPGKTVIGIEIPNEKKELIQLSQVLSAEEFDSAKSPISMALGHDIGGNPVVVDLAKMPHLLVAGTTGSGKSVGINAMILSLLFKSSPKDVRLIMIDPKMLELSVYDGIPHLLTPVITDMKDAANGLRWCVAEMERRYRLMSALGVRNLAGFNKKVSDAAKAGEPISDPLWQPDPLIAEEDQSQDDLEELPVIVVVVDELADMMMVVGKKVEELIARIAQKARAAGIHLILATQRPSVDVLTGLIKANIPTRISFMVQSKVDSRTILGEGGAEQLLGHGDMLFLPPGGGVAQRVHGAFVGDDEVHRVVADWKARGEPHYIESITSESTVDIPGISGSGGGEGGEESDALYDEAVYFVTQSRKASISAVQRKLRIGYNRAARMIEAMEMAGVVTEMNANGSREVLAPEPPKE